MNQELDHYVYALEHKCQIVYIGSGRDARIKHVLSGASHNPHLNQFSFVADRTMCSVYKIKENLSKEESLSFELELIAKHKPILNIKDVYCRNESATRGYLTSLSIEYAIKLLAENDCQDYE